MKTFKEFICEAVEDELGNDATLATGSRVRFMFRGTVTQSAQDWSTIGIRIGKEYTNVTIPRDLIKGDRYDISSPVTVEGSGILKHLEPKYSFVAVDSEVLPEFEIRVPNKSIS